MYPLSRYGGRNTTGHGITPEANNPIRWNRLRRFFHITVAVITCVFLLISTLILSLRWMNPPFTSFTLREDWDVLGMDRYSLRDWWTPWDQLPHHLRWAVIASEDQNFYSHWGFDFRSIQEAIDERREGVRRRGASTISQQVAKNLFLWPGDSYLRKGIEAGITLLIELLWPKDRILEVYLNIAEFGPGIFGVGRAAEVFFGIAPAQLEPDMSARLATVLPSPKRMRVEPPSPYVQRRSQWIIRQIANLTGISYAQPAPETREYEPELLTPDLTHQVEVDLPLMEFKREPLKPDFLVETDHDTLNFPEDVDTMEISPDQ